MKPKSGSNFDHVSKGNLYWLERRFFDWLAPKVPSFINSRHLCLSSIIWSVLVVLFYYLSTYNSGFLWFCSLVVFLQWITDSLDGTVGRLRKEGLVRWGFYCDHLLDYVFTGAILIGLSLIFTHRLFFFIVIMFVMGLFFVHAGLKHSATQELKISFSNFSATDLRIMVIIINSLLYFLGLNWFAKYFDIISTILIVLLLILIIRAAYITQNRLYSEEKRS